MPPQILIVDPSPTALLTLSVSLNVAGYSVAEAMSGPEAVGLALHLHPDLIITELALPGFDGWEVRRQVLADPKLERTPVVALTSYVANFVRQSALAAGFAEVLFKPVVDAELLLAMTRLVSPRSLIRPALPCERRKKHMTSSLRVV
ncbi:MAG: hypothetical protein RLZZ387_1092 [Chloroflexota bacterium]|jgi:CheY-like chemotaxis protein